MSENTKIEWATHTFNPWEGCQKVGPGCDNCYAENRNARFGGGTAVNWGPGAPRRRTSAANWRKPLAWNAAHEAFFAEHGYRQRVFCSSLADWLDKEVSIGWLVDLLVLIRSTPHLDWLLLTKRIGNFDKRIRQAFGNAQTFRTDDTLWQWIAAWLCGDEVPPNVWLGATIVNQEEADRDIPKLLLVPAHKRFLSMEPLLGPVDLTHIDIDGHSEIYPLRGTDRCEDGDGNPGPDLPALDWVIVGGESGPGARPMHPDWARSLRDQCAAAGVPFLFKQWGCWRPAAWFDGPDADLDVGDDFVDLDRLLLLLVNHQFLANDGRTWDTNGGRYMYPPLPLGHWCLMVNEGKKAAGRLLDDVIHGGFPS